MSKVVHVPISDAQHRELKMIAAQQGVTIGALCYVALAKLPTTRKAFQTKETK